MRHGGRQAHVERAVHQQAPDLLVGHLAHQVLDVHPAVAQRAAFLVRLGDLGRERDDALESGLNLGYLGHMLSSNWIKIGLETRSFPTPRMSIRTDAVDRYFAELRPPADRR